MVHAGLLLGGLATGAFIGFYWPPGAAVVALLTAALMARHSRPPELDSRP